ncbi:hypothetical protein [Rubricoccus marinus]|uniref:Uncharacterized protein n=1 Tax=Rubricoccus marinus TaxID=716817 RepID=A0A259U275_9BACT|nr:hypothetical protein [Rubricoccus marinus]OZC04135.1 hypothetical protein BSZ36_14775 [Rubricoccus marinus]
MSSLGVYLIGFMILTGGVAMGMHLAGLPAAWIAVTGVILLGLGILMGVSKTRTRDHSPM